MASSMLPMGPVFQRAGINTADERKPEPKKNTWWSPLFGFSSEPDYINSETAKPVVKARFEAGLFTEEKAKQLRRMAPDPMSHDMYHSAIATRLATDFSDRVLDA